MQDCSNIETKYTGRWRRMDLEQYKRPEIIPNDMGGTAAGLMNG